MLAVLNNFEAAIEAAAGVGTSGDLKEFRQLFVGHDGENVIPFVKTLIKQRDIRGRGTNTPPIAHLSETLTKLEACLRSADAKKAAADVSQLVEFLAGCGQASVGAVVGEARRWLVEASQAKLKLKPVRSARKIPAEPLHETLPLGLYAALLKQSAKDNTLFDQTVERLRADRKIRKADMREIAHLFLGYELAKKKGREDALAEIIERQAVEARQVARGSVLDRLKPW